MLDRGHDILGFSLRPRADRLLNTMRFRCMPVCLFELFYPPSCLSASIHYRELVASHLPHFWNIPNSFAAIAGPKSTYPCYVQAAAWEREQYERALLARLEDAGEALDAMEEARSAAEAGERAAAAEVERLAIKVSRLVRTRSCVCVSLRVLSLDLQVCVCVLCVIMF